MDWLVSALEWTISDTGFKVCVLVLLFLNLAKPRASDDGLIQGAYLTLTSLCDELKALRGQVDNADSILSSIADDVSAIKVEVEPDGDRDIFDPYA